MEVWIAVAVLGGIVSLLGIAVLVHRARQGRVTRLELGVVLATYVLILGALLATEVFRTRPVGSVFVLTMLPFWFLIASRARGRSAR
jgi:hypothetical protein